MRSKKSSRLSRSEFQRLKDFLDHKSEEYNNRDFIPEDPISIPHSFSKLQDIEISGLWTALLSWGQRKTIVNKSRELFTLMENAPHDFVLHSSDKEQARLMKFVHRTFQPTDTAYFLHFFHNWYSEHETLESAFIHGNDI